MRGINGVEFDVRPKSITGGIAEGIKKIRKGGKKS